MLQPLTPLERELVNIFHSWPEWDREAEAEEDEWERELLEADRMAERL